MLVIESSNVNTMLPLVMGYFETHAVPDDSRNGPVLRFPYPVALVYTRPLERVCFDPTRDANPFFHFMESMWMLAGRRDVEFVKFYNSNMATYSDDGMVFNAAYGYRMRRHFLKDQLMEVVAELRKDPKTRQAVINLWDPADLGKTTKDKACNLSLVFSRNHVSGCLDLTVYNRSNDAVWGAVTGANPVHMSYFLQFVAEASGFEPGRYYQIANNLHLYTQNEKSKAVLARHHSGGFDDDRYIHQGVTVPTLVDINHDRWLIEMEIFCDMAGKAAIISPQFHSHFIETVALPMHNAFAARRMGSREKQNEWLYRCADAAWAVAAREWCDRRDNK